MNFYLLPLFFSAFCNYEQGSIIKNEIRIADHAIQTIHLPGDPDFMVADGDAIWIINADRVEKLVFGQSKPIKTFTIPDPCGALVIGFGSIWVASCREKSLYRVNLFTGKTEAIISAGLTDSTGELSLAVGAGSIWLLTERSGILSRINPVTNQIINRISVKPNSFAAAFGYNSVWITNTGDQSKKEGGSVQRIDPFTNHVIATIPVGPVPRFLAVGSGAVWTLNQLDGTVTRINPATNKVSSTINTGVPGTGGDITTGNDKVYVRAKKILLSVIDPKKNKVIARYGPSMGSGAVRVANKLVWVSAHDVNTVWVLKK